MNTTPAMRTCLRLLSEADLYPIEFNVWAHAVGQGKPAPGRFVAAVLIRKMLGLRLIESNNLGGVTMTEMGREQYENMPEFRRGQQLRATKPRKRPDSKRGRTKGLTVYQFKHKSKEYTFTTERETTRQIRMIQAKEWEKNPNQVSSIEVKATRILLINDQNAAIALRDGIEALIAQTEVINYDPVERKGFYRHYLAAQQKRS